MIEIPGYGIYRGKRENNHFQMICLISWERLWSWIRSKGY